MSIYVKVPDNTILDVYNYGFVYMRCVYVAAVVTCNMNLTMYINLHSSFTENFLQSEYVLMIEWRMGFDFDGFLHDIVSYLVLEVE